MTQLIIGSLKINCLHSGAVVNIGEVIFNFPSNNIQLSAGSNSFCSGDGLTAITSRDPQHPDEEGNKTRLKINLIKMPDHENF